MPSPYVSVIIPTYNVERYIEQAIRSVLAQTFQDFEIIIVDDTSTDRTTEVIKTIKDQRIRVYVNEKNYGPSYSRNKAIHHARGEWIAVLDGDDWWEEHRLSSMLNAAKKHEADIVCDDLHLWKDGDSAPWSTCFTEKKIKFLSVINVTLQQYVKWDLGVLKPIIKRRMIEKNDLFYNDEISYGEDFVFGFEALMKGAKMILIPDAYYIYRRRQQSLIENRLLLYQKIYDSTEWLIDKYSNFMSSEVMADLQNRIKKTKQNIMYYQFMQPLKEKKFKLACQEIIKHPFVVFYLVRRVPQILHYRVFRHFKKGFSQS